MKKEYILTVGQAIQLATEFLKQSPKRRRVQRRLAFIALALACAYSLYKPPTASINEHSSVILMLVLAVSVQIPIIALLLYAAFLLAYDGPVRVVVRVLQKQPKESWGHRVIEVANGEIAIRQEQMSFLFKISYIDSIIETASGCHLLHGTQVLVSIPKTGCSCAEIKEALNDGGLDQASESTSKPATNAVSSSPQDYSWATQIAEKMSSNTVIRLLGSWKMLKYRNTVAIRTDDVYSTLHSNQRRMDDECFGSSSQRTR